MSLTELQIKQLKPKEKRYTISDGRGLILEIHPKNKAISKFLPLSRSLKNKKIKPKH